MVGKLIGFTALIIVCVLLAPWVVLMGWNAARELWPTLPQATYWQAFWITSGIMILFKGTSTSKK